MTAPGAVRIGDAERNLAAERLARHYAAGRLTQTEHEERLSLALAARTGADLDPLFADLPPLLDDRPDRPRAVRRRFGRLWLVVAAAAVAAWLTAGALAGRWHAGASSAAPSAPSVGAPTTGVMTVHAHGPGLLPALVLLAAVVLAVRAARRRRGWSH